MTAAPTFYTVRQGFRETLMAFLGEDAETGEPIEREATVEEEHQHWIAAEAHRVTA
jgi:hypothetical protein